jgi:hypothetical protein
MSHFAEIKDGIVQRVLSVEKEYVDSGRLGDPSNWIQTSYNTRGGIHYAPNSSDADGGTPLRKNYAGKGMIYDEARDAFYYHQPYPSWTLDEATCQWESPVPRPVDGRMYTWNEETQAWDLVEE